jgi:hypothetical protein
MAGATLHTSLRPGTNALLAALWLAGLVGLVMIQRDTPWVMISLGLLGGIVQGFLQQRALRDEPARFREARTALQVRAALMSTAAGRAQIKALWGSLAIYFVAALVRGAPNAFEVPLAIFTAMLAQWFVRESVTVSACRYLERSGGAV